MPTRKQRVIYQRRSLSPDQLVNNLASLRLNNNTDIPTGGDGPRTSFDDMGLKPELLKGIYNYGLEKPAAIQKVAIVPGIYGKDLILQAQSGMGKTAAMAVITLQRLRPENPACQAMILVPTRELALQVKDVFNELGKFMETGGKIKAAAYIGGTGISRREHAELRKGGIHVIVGTLGRLANIIRDSVIDPLALEIFVIDEADKMLTDFSFRRDIQYIVSKMSGSAQVMLMSATMPPTALKYAEQITRNPKTLLIPNYQLTLDGIKQFYINTGDADATKLVALEDILSYVTRMKKHTIVFCRTRGRVRALFNTLVARGHNVGSIEGEQEQFTRLSVLQRFRTSEVTTLISSEVLGRGIDVQQVYVVINYDVPTRIEEYIHRVGRAGRYGRKGLAVTFVTDGEATNQLPKIETFYETMIEQMPMDIEKFMI